MNTVLKFPPLCPILTVNLFVLVKTDMIIMEPRQIDLFEWIDGEPMGSVENGRITTPQESDISTTPSVKIAARLHQGDKAGRYPIALPGTSGMLMN